MNRVDWITRTFGWLTEQLYSELAWAYDPVSSAISRGKWATWRNEALAHVSGYRVLELGFGTGETLIALHRKGFKVIGLEKSFAMHKVTAYKLRQQRIINIPRIMGIAQQLPFPASTFDTVVATFPAEYIFDPNTLSEVKRVLRPYCPNRNAVVGRFIVVGLFAKYRGKTFGWISKEDLLNRDKLARWAPGWEVHIIEAKLEKVSLPVVIFEKQKE